MGTNELVRHRAGDADTGYSYPPRVAADPALKQAAAQGTLDRLGRRDC